MTALPTSLHWIDEAARHDGIPILRPERPLRLITLPGWYCRYSMVQVEGRFCPMCGRERKDAAR